MGKPDLQTFSPLPRSFYARSARLVAPALLGQWLLRRTPKGLVGGPIVETEAYLQEDPACHAANGRTKRNKVMFGPPGKAYVYYIYGMHHCVNAVCMREGTGEAVLIRAIEPRLRPDLMARLRAVDHANLTNGPGKLCAAIGITLAINGDDLCQWDGDLVIASHRSHPELIKKLGPIGVSPRIGITKAANLPLRFYLERSRHVSRAGRPRARGSTTDSSLAQPRLAVTPR